MAWRGLAWLELLWIALVSVGMGAGGWPLAHIHTLAKMTTQHHPYHIPNFARQDARECHVHAAFLWISLITFLEHVLELVAPMFCSRCGIGLFGAGESTTLSCNALGVQAFSSSSTAAARAAEVQSEKLAKTGDLQEALPAV